MTDRFERFGFIHRPRAPAPGLRAIDDVYTVEDLRTKFTVFRAGKPAEYFVCPSFDEFWQYYRTLPEHDRIFHEVIFDQPQKLKFDIDASADAVEAAPLLDGDGAPVDARHHDRFRLIRDSIIETIRSLFLITWDVELDDSNIVVCESRALGTAPKKYSSHVIITGYYVSGHESAREFTTRLFDHLPAAYRQLVDASVNKRIQNFRLVGSHKEESEARVKRVVGDQHTDADTVVTAVAGGIRLRDIHAEGVRVGAAHPHHTGDTATVLQICAEAGILKHHRFNMARDGMFLFTRVTPSYCEFCERTHDKDNTVMVSVGGTPPTVFKHCRRYNAEHPREKRSAPIGTICEGAAPPQRERRGCDGIVKAEIDRPAPAPPTLFGSLVESPGVKIVSYCEPALLPFESGVESPPKTLVVHAAMKMGKTKALRRYIDECFAETSLRKPVIRFLSFRQTFSGNIMEKFPDFTLYSDVKGALDQRRVVVQIESLHRLEILHGAEPPDLLIVDECESIFDQFDSGLLRRFGESFSKFEYLMRYSKQAVFMDAGLSDRSYRVIEKMRGFDNLVYHRNTYKNGSDDEYILTGNQTKWLAALHSCIKSDEKVAIAASSLKEAKAMAETLARKFKGLKIRLYSSETSDAEKREHFANVNVAWKDCDVLIYTPTVSAGVSFEVAHFDRMFGYFIDSSCPVETCMQMLGRIRNVGEKQYCVYIEAFGNNLPATIDAISEQLFSRRANLFQKIDDAMLNYDRAVSLEYAQDGALWIKPTNYFCIWAENTRVRNLSRNNFARQFIRAVRENGSRVLHLSDDVFEQITGMEVGDGAAPNPEIVAIRDEHNNSKASVAEKESAAVAEARDITADEADNIRAAVWKLDEVQHDDKKALEKYRIRTAYGLRDDFKISKEFVAQYGGPQTLRVYRNLTRISTYHRFIGAGYSPAAAIKKALEQIQEDERAAHVFNRYTDQHQADLNRRYVFDQHLYTVGLIKICGWESPFDQRSLHVNRLYDNLVKAGATFWSNIAAACAELGVRAPLMSTAAANRDNVAAYVKLTLSPLNSLLKLMYGMRVSPDGVELYKLAHSGLFRWGDGPESVPLIVPPAIRADLTAPQ